MLAGDIVSMPDNWEYAWFVAWDLAFHCAPLSLVDVDFATEQIELLLATRYAHRSRTRASPRCASRSPRSKTTGSPSSTRRSS